MTRKIIKSNKRSHKRRAHGKARVRQDLLPSAPRFGPMPKTIKLMLTYRNSVELSLTSGVNRSYSYGLLEYGNQLPLYAAQLYQLYKYSRIYRVDIETQANAVPGGTAYGFDIALGRMTWDECGSGAISPDTVALTNGAVHGKGGLYMGKPITLRKSFDSERELGNPIYGVDSWQTYIQAQTVSGTPFNPWAVIAVASTPSTGSVNVSMTTTVAYHIEFFSLDMSPSATTQVRQVIQPEEELSYIEDISVAKHGTNPMLPQVQKGITPQVRVVRK